MDTSSGWDSRAGGGVIVAGHICLDVIPNLPMDEAVTRFRPGALAEIGPATVATGGCVSNTGRALHQLGAPTRLLGKVGDDAFGSVVAAILARAGLADGLLVTPGAHTSYSIILSPPGRDRMVLHYPGANDTFAADDIPDGALTGARLFHFGYPPLMRRMYEDGGMALGGVMRRARAAGLTTALDMAYPDPASAAGHADWRGILAVVLPCVDVFVPSLEEVLVMLEPEQAVELAGGSVALDGIPAERVSELGDQLLALGAGIVGIKVGERGFYLRTASAERLAAAGPGIPRDHAAWVGRELWSSVFDTRVVGTNGAGDATVAGFLYALLHDMAPEDAITAACAAGASSVEASDATSGIVTWDRTRRRIAGGWARHRPTLGVGWLSNSKDGIWSGPHDRQPHPSQQAREHVQPSSRSSTL